MQKPGTSLFGFRVPVVAFTFSSFDAEARTENACPEPGPWQQSPRRMIPECLDVCLTYTTQTIPDSWCAGSICVSKMREKGL
ncbi:hypothetical protein K432DRAFT_387694 [Lepidopterella palustris CBS 459.81]|uniref:Uncharacterized protein n=1 Tax=Lepidopterella palustris CBS 459.81 TaxID=1314670 RepID=A0A8E2DW13_9PEZI|nr:hypothetical protein K432DRAFT_387694 [Lepidopterella palustris CBS 459.81]